MNRATWANAKKYPSGGVVMNKNSCSTKTRNYVNSKQ